MYVNLLIKNVNLFLIIDTNIKLTFVLIETTYLEA